MAEIITSSPSETEAFAEKFAQTLKSGTVIAFTGGMGMGKTCFTHGLAQGLGYTGCVTSPTFALVNEYIGGRLPLYHFDMFRVTSWEDLYSTGFYDYLEAGGVLVIEWSENISSALPEGTVYINIEKLGDAQRRITVSGGAKQSENTGS